MLRVSPLPSPAPGTPGVERQRRNSLAEAGELGPPFDTEQAGLTTGLLRCEGGLWVVRLGCPKQLQPTSGDAHVPSRHIIGQDPRAETFSRGRAQQPAKQPPVHGVLGLPDSWSTAGDCSGPPHPCLRPNCRTKDWNPSFLVSGHHRPCLRTPTVTLEPA